MDISLLSLPVDKAGISTLLDHILQSIIHFENNPSQKQAQTLLNEYIPYIDNDIDLITVNELISFILSLLNRYQDQPSSFFNDILDKSRLNTNRILLTASIFSHLHLSKNQFTFSSYRSFVTDSFGQIIGQIRKPSTEKFIIFGHEIPQRFKNDFIINILLLTKLKQKYFTFFQPYIFSHKNVDKGQLSKLIHAFLKAGFAPLFEYEILTDKYFFSCFSMESFSLIIPHLPDELFEKILTPIGATFSKEKKWSRSFSLSILEKVIKLNIKFELIQCILQSISPFDMKPSVWKYLSNFDVVLPLELSSAIQKFPCPISALKVMPAFDRIPSQIISLGLLGASTFSIYERIFDLNAFITNDVFSTSKFWIHIVSIASKSTEKCSQKLLSQFAELFLNFVEKSQVYKIFDSMIFHHKTITNNGYDFISDLLNFFDTNYLSEYYQNIELIFQKVIDQGIIPLPSFWKFIDINYIVNLLETNSSNPLLMYAYQFSYKNENSSFFKKITVLTKLNAENRSYVIEFINRKNSFDYLTNTNEDVLSLVMSALIFVSSSEKPEIQGLTKENLLPFFAIAFNYLAICQGDLLFDSSEIINKLQLACNYLSRNNSPLLTTSINSILSNCNFFCNFDVFSVEAAFQILDTLIPLLIRNLYKADKLLLLTVIFSISSQNQLKREMKLIFKKHGINLFKFIIEKVDFSQNFDRFEICKFNLDVLDESQIQDIIIDCIQNSTKSENIIKTIYFIEKVCKKVPELKITNFEKLIQLIHSKIDEKNWDEVLLIGQFLINHDFKSILTQFSKEPIPFRLKEILFDEIEIELKDLFSDILNDQQPETHFLPFELLFKNLMKDEAIAMNYFLILFEKVTQNQTLDLDLFLCFYSDKFQNYGDLIINTLSCFYCFHSDSKSFIRKIEPKPLPESQSGISMVSQLIEKVEENCENFQLFFCLFDIVSSFPFLFTKNPLKLFNCVLKALDNFDLYFTYKGEFENKVKASFLALLLLYKSLYSIEILNLFVPWLFENIVKFTESQVLALTFVILSFINTKKVRKIFLAFSIEYNLPEILNTLIQKQVKKEIYIFYQQNLLLILSNYYSHLNELSKFKIISIDKIRHVKNPFNNAFNNFTTIFPLTLESIDFSSLNDNDQISNFLSYVIENRPFWLTFYDDSKSEVHFSDDLISHYIRLKKGEINDSFDSLLQLPDINFDYSIKAIQYLSGRPDWILKWVLNDVSFPSLPKHNEILFDVITELNKYDEEFDILDENITINDYFPDQYINEKLFEYLIKNAVNADDYLFEITCSLFVIITENPASVIQILNMIYFHITCHEFENEYLCKIINLLLKIKNNEEFEDNFIKICGNYLIELALSPHFRNDSAFLKNFAELLCSVDVELPSNAVHLVGFMFILNQPQVVPQALFLCEKIGIKKIGNLMEIIEASFDRELNSPNRSYSMIHDYLDIVPSLSKKKTAILTQILNEAIKSAKDQEDQEESENLICSIFNSFAPERKKDLLITQEDMDEIDFSLSCSTANVNSFHSSKQGELKFLERKIPPKIIQTDPAFWNLYQRNIKLIDDIIQKDNSKLEMLKFLFDYPEMMNFETRTLYFRKRMENRINYENALLIDVKRSKILSNSFKQLSRITNKEWLNKITVNFVGEEGLDAGGLTKEWFSLIVKELFEPEKGLFKSTESQSYQPIHSTNLNEKDDRIQLFEFAGKIIARSLIQGQFVNAHLMRSFIRQILHRQVKLIDLRDYDEYVYQSMIAILDNDNYVDDLDLNFTIDIGLDGQNSKTIELKENGANIKVDKNNKNEYVSLYTNYRLRTSIKDEISAFCKGFDALIPPDEIRIFTASELDLLICGIPKIDLDDLQENTEYEYPYDSEHPVIKLFFKVISKWDKNNKAKFLLFLTGSSQVPLNGFKYFKDIGKPITISPGGDKERLCVAHTCFNTLDLPRYENENEMNDKLLLSIQECEFGIL